MKSKIILAIVLLLLTWGSVIVLSVMYGWIAGVLAFVLYVASFTSGYWYLYDVNEQKKRLTEEELQDFINDIQS